MVELNNEEPPLMHSSSCHFSFPVCVTFYILLLYFTLSLWTSKFPPNLLMPEIKCQHPGDIQCRCTLHFLVLSYSRNDYSKDFLMYDHDPGGLW